MKLGDLPLAHQTDFKYSERQNVVWAIYEVSQDVHISFYPHGPGAEEYKEKMLAIITDWAQEHDEWSAKRGDWFKLWMLNSLPFDMFHVTVNGKHFYFKEDGTVLGESSDKGAITEKERVAAWKASGYVMNNTERPWPPTYNFNTDPTSFWNRTSTFPHGGQTFEGTYVSNPYESSWPRMEWSAKDQAFSFK